MKAGEVRTGAGAKTAHTPSMHTTAPARSVHALAVFPFVTRAYLGKGNGLIFAVVVLEWWDT